MPPGRVKGSVPPDEKRCVHSVGPKENGQRCKNWRMDESTLCATHGRAPQIQTARQRRIAQADAKRRALQRLEKEGYPVIRGPEAVIEILEERLAVQVGMVRALDELVEKLAQADELRYEHRAGEQLRGELQAWLQINQMVTRLGSDYLKIGLDERKVRISEAQARVLLNVLAALAVRLELTTDQRKIWAVAVPEELERAAIEAGASS